MSKFLSVPDIIGRLENQLAEHRKREAFHAEQEAFHRERRAHHAAESERIAASLESFQTTAAAATDLVNHPGTPPRTAPAGGARAPRLSLARMVAAALEHLGLFEPFGISKVTTEVNRLFGDRLRHPVDSRQVSVVLRRMASRRQIHVVQKGRQRLQTLYTRERPEGTAG